MAFWIIVALKLRRNFEFNKLQIYSLVENMNTRIRNRLAIQSIACFFLFLFVIQGVIQQSPFNAAGEIASEESSIKDNPLAQDDYGHGREQGDVRQGKLRSYAQNHCGNLCYH